MKGSFQITEGLTLQTMSERRDYLEAHPELEELTPVELEKHLEDAGQKAEAIYESLRDEEYKGV